MSWRHEYEERLSRRRRQVDRVFGEAKPFPLWWLFLVWLAVYVVLNVVILRHLCR